MESKKKKILFLKSLIDKLNLTDVEIAPGRIEEIGKTLKPVPFIVSRAVTDLISLIKWSKDCIHPQMGILIAIKGPGVRNELDRLNDMTFNLDITGYQLEKYDPFPSLMPLKNTYIVVIQRCIPPKPLFSDRY